MTDDATDDEIAALWRQIRRLEADRKADAALISALLRELAKSAAHALVARRTLLRAEWFLEEAAGYHDPLRREDPDWVPDQPQRAAEELLAQLAGSAAGIEGDILYPDVLEERFEAFAQAKLRTDNEKRALFRAVLADEYGIDIPELNRKAFKVVSDER